MSGFCGAVNRGMSPIILSVEAPQETQHRSLSPRTLSKFANGSNARREGPKIITWARKTYDSEKGGEPSDLSINYYRSNEPDKEDEFLYQNVSNTGANYIEYKLNGIIKTGNVESEKMKNAKNQGGAFPCKDDPKGSSTGNRQIEVRQIKNKTVVKISIKDDEESWKNGGENEFRCGKTETKHSGRESSEKKSGNYDDFENSKESDTFQFSEIYANLNASDPECDQTYENQDFEVLRKSHVTQSLLEKNPEPDGEKRDDGERIYENQLFFDDEETYENLRLSTEGRKSESPKAFVRVNVRSPLQQKGRDYQPGEIQTISEDNSYQKVRSRKVVVTISSAQTDKSESDEIKKNVVDYAENELGHKRAESLTSSGVGVDSEESDDEESNISCDSLNSNELNALSTSEDHGYHTPNSEHKTGSPVDDYQNIGRYSEGISDIGFAYENGKFGEEREDIYENFRVFGSKKQASPPPPPPKPVQKVKQEMKSLPKGLLLDIQARKASINGESSDETPSPKKVTSFGQIKEEIQKKEAERPKIEEKTYEERKIADFRSEKVSKICAMDVDTDQFYKFHLFENRQEANSEKGATEEETFAGVKDYLNREKQAAIKSAKGTIRGVKNRVKAGIATFLQMQENKTYKDKDAGKIVVYSTTMGIVRETYHKCLKVKQILRTLMVKFEERDVFMSTEAQEEIRERMKCEAIMVPQVFVEGQHIGDAETIERLNESGELRRILKPYKSPDACVTCQVCGGYRLLPCSVCKGSKKSVHRNHFTAEFVALKCMNCDQVGLTKCYAC